MTRFDWKDFYVSCFYVYTGNTLCVYRPTVQYLAAVNVACCLAALFQNVSLCLFLTCTALLRTNNNENVLSLNHKEVSDDVTSGGMLFQKVHEMLVRERYSLWPSLNSSQQHAAATSRHNLLPGRLHHMPLPYIQFVQLVVAMAAETSTFDTPDYTTYSGWAKINLLLQLWLQQLQQRLHPVFTVLLNGYLLFVGASSESKASSVKVRFVWITLNNYECTIGTAA